MRPRLSSRGRTFRHNGGMRVSAKADYALRAVIELAVIGGESPVKGERIAQAQEIPLKFLENILGDLRHAGIVRSQRGVEGGYWLARPAGEITVAEVDPRRWRARSQTSAASARSRWSTRAPPRTLREVWIAVRANLRAVLEHVTSPTWHAASCRSSSKSWRRTPTPGSRTSR